MRLFVFFADKLLQWGRRVEQEAGYAPREPIQVATCDPAVEPLRQDADREAPPEHWARLVRSEPPPHWLELFRRATEAEQFPEDGAWFEDPLALEEPEHNRSAVDGDSSEEQPRVEARPTQTPRNRSDYSANRETVRDRSRRAPPAVTPARFLDRLRFSAEPPASQKTEPDYVTRKPAEPATPAVYPNVPVDSRSEAEPFSSRAVPPAPYRDQNNFPVRPPVSSQSNSFDFADKSSKAAGSRAAKTAERSVAAERLSDSVEDNKRFVVSEKRAQTKRPERPREADAETENPITNFGRFFSRRHRESSPAQQPEYAQSGRQFSQEPRTPGPQSNNQQPATVSFVDSPPRSPGPRVTVPAQATVTPRESSLKFSEQSTGERAVARRRTSYALTENSQSRHRTAEIFGDPNKDYWPTLPPASLLDSEDELFAREAEAETLRRLEQEQRGTLWSE